MRKILSILVLLALGLGAIPVDALASGLASGWTGKVDESRLSACCRRNGRHHCSMGSPEQQSAHPSSETAVSAKEFCPCMPRALASTVPPMVALVHTAATSTAYASQRRASQNIAATARLTDRRSQPKRGPPAIQIL
jgi:hypothetical protein